MEDGEICFAWIVIEFKTPWKNLEEKTEMIRRNMYYFKGLLLGNSFFWTKKYVTLCIAFQQHHPYKFSVSCL